MRAWCSSLAAGLGAFVPAGSPLLTIRGNADPPIDESGVLDAIVLGLDRSLDQDVAYGLRLLVDIAERSLADSPFLDPTTAVQALDRLHDCLRNLQRDRSPRDVWSTMTVASEWSCRSCPGTTTCAWRFRRSAWPGPVHRRSHDGFGTSSTISLPWRPPTDDRCSNTSSNCSTRQCGTATEIRAMCRRRSTADRQGIGISVTSSAHNGRSLSTRRLGRRSHGHTPARSHGSCSRGRGRPLQPPSQQGEGCVWIRRLC